MKITFSRNSKFILLLLYFRKSSQARMIKNEVNSKIIQNGLLIIIYQFSLVSTAPVLHPASSAITPSSQRESKFLLKNNLRAHDLTRQSSRDKYSPAFQFSPAQSLYFLKGLCPSRIFRICYYIPRKSATVPRNAGNLQTLATG